MQKMRKMKDSGIEWIGEIPEGWEVVPVKRLCTMQAGKNLTSEQIAPEGTYPVYGGNGIRGFFSDYNCDGQFLTVGRQGALCGNVHKINGKVWATEHAVITTPSSYTILDFLYFLLIGMDLNQYVSSTAAQPGLAVGTLLNLKTCYPCSTLEQTQISNYLNAKCSEIDIMLTKTRSSIEEYKKLKQAVITQAVTKGVRGEREMKDSGVEWIGEIPKYWNIGKLKYYWISVESGVSVNAADRPIDNPAQYGVLKTSSVSKFIFNPHEHKQVNNDEYSRVTCPVTADCIIVSRMNTPDLVGACGYVEKTYPNLFLPDRLWQISFKNDVSAKFIWYYLNNKMVRSYISSLSTGTSSTMQNISQGQFGNISVCLPDSNEQKEIADYLDAKCAEIDKLIAKKEQLVKELECYKKSLIYKVVTGKREV